ncbi:MAG: hypothetical protein AVDCRST_MAG76-63, partial [uncultured Acidimicrobiales bacterium]
GARGAGHLGRAGVRSRRSVRARAGRRRVRRRLEPRHGGRVACRQGAGPPRSPSRVGGGAGHPGDRPPGVREPPRMAPRAAGAAERL